MSHHNKIVSKLNACICNAILLAGMIGLLYGCSSTRFVPDGAFLLDKVKINIKDTIIPAKGEELRSEDFIAYIPQQPNHKIFWSLKSRLGIYNLAGKDSTKWWNKWIKRLGEPPVIYDSGMTGIGVNQLQTALINKGYLKAEVKADTIANPSGKKMKVVYTMKPGLPYRVRNVSMEVADSAMASILAKDTSRLMIRPGDLLDRNVLSSQRDRLTSRLRNNGYYTFMSENIRFSADTTAGSTDVDLTIIVDSEATPSMPEIANIRKYLIRRVICVTNYSSASVPLTSLENNCRNVENYKDITILYGDRRYLRPKVIYENLFITPGSEFSQRGVDLTYKAFSRLEILKFINIRCEQAGELGDIGLLDVYVLLTPGKSMSTSVELEGTNSEGDFGVALGLTFTHRNIGKGSETFTAKARGAYEAIKGDFEGLLHNSYMEYSLDFNLSFPKFKAPFLKQSFKRRVNASTDLNLAMNYQQRPEYTRIISNAGWSYKWTDRFSRSRHTFTPVDINYVYLPESTNDFLNNIAPDNPLLRYSYENHFIMRMGYSFYHTNKRTQRQWERNPQRNIYTIRASAEFAGNLLFLLSSIFNHRSNFHENPYKIFGIQYSQYFRADSDVGFTHVFDSKQSLATRVGLGIGVPYGNSGMLPFEKRFYGGGANGVRGWEVRTLGPGTYRGTNRITDYMNQCGDIRFIMSAEYRAKIFWIVELGLFIDAGNIWTIHNYPAQPGGMFHFKSFYKELAAAYGIGIRLDFDYFLLRFDLGMKAHNPAEGEDPWPLIHPRWGRDRAFHFSIGYPF